MEVQKKYFVKVIQFIFVVFLGVYFTVIQAEITEDSSPHVQQVNTSEALNLPKQQTDALSSQIALLSEKNGEPVTVSDSNYSIFVFRTTGLAVVKDIRNGILYYSNPPDADEDSLAIDKWKSNIKSQIMIEIYDKKTTMSKSTNSFQGSARKNGISISSTRTSITVIYDFPDDKISVPIEYRLEEDGFTADVDMTKISIRTEDILLQRIHILPFFASAGQNEKGYSMVPDGSGALIYFNNSKNTVNSLSLQVFGEDKSILKNSQLAITSPTYLPVFGMKKREGGFLAVITKSEAIAQIESYVSGMVSGYNNTYASFLIRNSDLYQIIDRSGGTRDIRVIDENTGDLKNLSVRYMLLDKNSCDYVAMGNKYRDYLIKIKGATATNSDYNALYLNFYGAVEKIEPFLGFPVNKIQPLSTYSQIVKVVKELNAAGIEDFGVRYLFSSRDFIKKSKPGEITEYSKLGTKQEFDELNRLLGENLYHSVEFMNIASFKSITGALTGAVKSPIGAIAYQYYYNKASNQPIKNGDRWYLTRPAVLQKNLNGFLSRQSNRTDAQSICFESIGSQLYSHFDSDTITRSGLQEIVVEAFNKQYMSNSNKMFSGANSYIIPYADKLTDITTGDSGYAITDTEIPFLQIAARGIAELIVPPLNISSDSADSFLKAVEAGNAISFSLICDETSLLHETNLQWLYAGGYKAWFETISKYYNEYEILYKEIAGKKIIAHSSPSNGVILTTYENGYVVYINYTKEPYISSEVAVPGRSFKWIKTGNTENGA